MSDFLTQYLDLNMSGGQNLNNEMVDNCDENDFEEIITKTIKNLTLLQRNQALPEFEKDDFNVSYG